MNVSSKCPSSADLRELLEGSLPDSDQAVVVAHLDQCSGCQHSLEALANPDSSLAITLLDQASHKAPDGSSAYWPALKNAEMALTKNAISPGLPDRGSGNGRSYVSLAFLNPPPDGSNLGTLVNFNIVRVVGRGGMGIVLQAVDTCLQRDVAIKILDPELANDELAVKRFCREARAAASINHENVVAVHQVEEDEEKNIPFLVMELISGESLEKKIEREGRLPLKEMVRIGMQTAAGLAAAHDRGLIHRDIKPGNILLEQSGQRVKLTDFGLARAVEDVHLTRSGLVAGTPLYMSPEQASGEELDARSDLFSLGVVLYELAAGEPPFTGKTPLIVLKRVTEEQPRPLRERNPDLPEWFVQIVDKLLAKNPKDRFQTAREVAEVLEHFWVILKSSETPPCPKKKAPHPWKAVVLGMTAGLLTLLLGSAGFFLLAPRWQGADEVPTPLHIFKGTGGPIWSMAVAKDGKHLAVGADNGTVKYWDIGAEKVDWEFKPHKTPIWALAISPQSDFLATGSDDGITKIWDLATKDEAFKLPKVPGVRALAFDAAGKRVLIGSRDGSAKIWDFRTPKELVKISEEHGSLVSAVAFAPDDKTFATASADKTIKIWDAGTGKLKLTLTGHESGVYGIAFAPKAPYLVSGGWDRSVRLWNLDSGAQVAKLDGHTQDVWSVAFNAAGTHFASAGEDQMVRVYDLATQKETRSFRASTGAVLHIAFSEPDGLVAAGKDGTARMWRISALAR